jgi:hypothetical protein
VDWNDCIIAMKPILNINTTTSNIDISALATLSITMTIQAEAKPKKRTKYRPVQRPDGVIVLQRPYRPTASPAPAPKFEKHLPTFVVPTATHKQQSTRRRDEDLAGVGSRLTETGGEDNNDSLEAGRGGYNDPCYRSEEVWGFLEDVQRTRNNRQITPMQRFLGESGPWSTFESREV